MGEIQRITISKASLAIGRAYDAFINKRFPKMGDIVIGKVEQRMKRYAREHNVEMANGGLVLNIKKFSHMIRQEKRRIDKAVGRDGWVSFPKEYRRMRLYWDHDKRNFVYVSTANKFIVEPNKQLNTSKERVVLVTGQKINPKERFDMPRFIEIYH